MRELISLVKTKIFTAVEILCKEKKHLDTKSIFEYLKKNETADIFENQLNN